MTDVVDADGHTFSGGVVKTSFSIANKGNATSLTLWIVLGLTEFESAPSGGWGKNWNSAGPDAAKRDDSYVYIPGRVLKPGGSFTWTTAMFWEEPSRMDYTVQVYEGPTWAQVADLGVLSTLRLGHLVKDYGARFTTVKIC